MKHTKLLQAVVFFSSSLGFFWCYTRFTLSINNDRHVATALHLQQELARDDENVGLNATERKALLKVEAKLAVDKKSMRDFCEKNNKTFVWNTEKPLRILLVTTWRSGSTFLGNVLANNLATFYFYEPLMAFVKQTITGVNAEQAVDQLKSLFHCRMPQRYMSSYKTLSSFFVSKNIGLWDSCSSKNDHHQMSRCKSRAFLKESCRKFPIQVAKVVRLRLHSVESLLNDPSLEGLKVIYLVRDPRGTMNSRWKVSTSLKQVWCARQPDCSNPQRLCNFMEADLSAYDRLSKLYPDRMVMVKYEDIALNPLLTIRKIFHFSGLHYTEKVQSMVRQLTLEDGVDYPGGIQKKSANRAYMWKTDLKQDQMALVEENCSTVIKALGYEL